MAVFKLLHANRQTDKEKIMWKIIRNIFEMFAEISSQNIFHYMRFWAHCPFIHTIVSYKNHK